jgi:hypothetical protein
LQPIPAARKKAKKDAEGNLRQPPPHNSGWWWWLVVWWLVGGWWLVVGGVVVVGAKRSTDTDSLSLFFSPLSFFSFLYKPNKN